MEQRDLPLEYPCVNPCLLCVLPHFRLSFLFGGIEWAGTHNGIQHFSDGNDKAGNVLHFGLLLGRCVLCASLKIQRDKKAHTCQRWRDECEQRDRVLFCLWALEEHTSFPPPEVRHTHTICFSSWHGVRSLQGPSLSLPQAIQGVTWKFHRSEATGMLSHSVADHPGSEHYPVSSRLP